MLSVWFSSCPQDASQQSSVHLLKLEPSSCAFSLHDIISHLFKLVVGKFAALPAHELIYLVKIASFFKKRALEKLSYALSQFTWI